MIEVCSWYKCESFLVQTFTRLNGRHGAFLSGSNIRVETSADHPDERPALLRDPDDFVVQLDQPIGLQRRKPGHLLGEDVGIAAKVFADFAEIDPKVAHQTLDNRRAKPIVVVQDQTPCDRELTRLHCVPVGMHGSRVLNIAPRQRADRRGAEAETHRRAIGGIALKVPV